MAHVRRPSRDRAITPNLPIHIILTRIARLKLSGKCPMDLTPLRTFISTPMHKSAVVFAANSPRVRTRSIEDTMSINSRTPLGRWDIRPFGIILSSGRTLEFPDSRICELRVAHPAGPWVAPSRALRPIQIVRTRL